MQKHKHGSNRKTKENPSPASGLQGEDSAVSSAETRGRRVRRQRGQWGGSAGRDGWQRGHGSSAAMSGDRGDRERGAQPQFCKRRDQWQPRPSETPPTPLHGCSYWEQTPWVLPGSLRTASPAVTSPACPQLVLPTPSSSHQLLTPPKRSAPHQPHHQLLPSTRSPPSSHLLPSSHHPSASVSLC